ncbi:glycoside hydrolase family 3 N-terminal domain-containing protein [Novosphingobium mangrovi (ex Hu et al. 2023)]|uniref:Glycoside hydrolase family 3 C-terminal domain-containing protein n=1 Tax=Novosphingobium mangrovi (ex Hu et al. 2023) TaxID=2930094 RepID=A0ABT0AFL3_9SPHN|nr:glycoside hydrolase family 3 N-terminal domain-containing protein [Novosphingobium mangrovi (ex Hu et al. 2023)]MCJ1961964.1 glycoside hydrolase family 3 C-terminal domain-containing protein [Novosphingobium mangrovi (ex Hu et al. 2023)]
MKASLPTARRTPTRRVLGRLLLMATCLVPAGALVVGGMANRAEARAAASTEDEAVTARAKALLAQMTPEEKAGQLVQYFYLGEASATSSEAMTSAISVEDAVARGEVGSLLLMTDPVEINRLQKIAVEKTRLGIPLLFGFDVIHGFRTIMPVPLAMAASWDPSVAEKGQAVAAAEARAAGVNWTFAPMVDIARDARWGRIVEGAGEDPVLGAAMAAAQVRGFQGEKIGTPGRILAGPKHFAGYGASLGGRDYDEVDLSDSELRNVYFPPFKAAIDAGAGNIMAAYMQLNGVPATTSSWLLNEVLRKEWGFDGFVVSDANNVSSLVRQGAAANPEEAAVRAIRSGLDLSMEMPAKNSPMLSLAQSLKDGTLDAKTLDTAVLRLLEAKVRLGLFEQPYADPAKAKSVAAKAEHRDIARMAAERAAVLLENSKGVLPLDTSKTQSIALIGPFANAPHDQLGPWVFPGPKPVGVSVLEGLKAKLGDTVKVTYAPGVPIPKRINRSFFDDINPPVDLPEFAEADEAKTAAEFDRAVAAAKDADVAVLVLGEAQNMAGEAASRASFELPGHQQRLLEEVIATGKPVVVVLMNARPINLQGAKPDALLEAWYPGSEGGPAIANLLTGDAVPGGKLPISWIRDGSQAPFSYDRMISHAPWGADTRYWDQASNAPLYEFGYGLSYTTFEYGNLTVAKDTVAKGEPVEVSFDLTNTGSRAADEVAQLYIHQRSGTSSRPERQLKKFRRIALQPGETQRVTFTLTADDLRYWSSVTKDWIQDASIFDVWAGGSSKADLAGEFTVTP